MKRLLIMALLALPACKTRDPDAPGLLSEGRQVPSEEANLTDPHVGAYTLSCRPQDQDSTKNSFVITVRGAVSQTDESQPLVVSVDRIVGDGTDRLAEELPGRGAVRLTGSIFVGFTSGVLTADFTGKGGKTSHTGLLTLAADPHVDGTPVDCQAAAL